MMRSPDVLIPRLEALLGASAVRSGAAETVPYAVDECRPIVAVRPESVEQVVDVLSLAAREQWSVVPWGQGTQMHLGGVPARYDLALSLASLDRIIEYDAANLILIAEAGLPLRETYRQSLPERQFLPLGFAGTQASLGGLLATNTSGVKRARYGGLRDLLLGVKVALPEGALVRFGGRVVKNVAGYDMNKLFVGSLGAFGVVVETCYRLAAMPEDDRLLAVVFSQLSQAVAAAAAVQASPLQPSALMLLTAAAATGAWPLSIETHQVALLLNVDGLHEAVERQLRDAEALCEQHAGRDAVRISGEALLSVWEAREQWQAAPPALEPAHLQVQLGVLPSHLEAVLRALAERPPFASGTVSWWTDYVHGQVVAHIPLGVSGSGDSVRAVRAWLTQLRTQVRGWYGYCNLTVAPPNLKRHLDIWGESSNDALLRLYKQQFDPRAILNPGRYVAGL
jgi:glycolate oxidase FAD binding subunit